MASADSPAARLSRITETIIRVPLIHALPWHTFGSTLICSRHFIALAFLPLCSLLSQPCYGRAFTSMVIEITTLAMPAFLRLTREIRRTISLRAQEVAQGNTQGAIDHGGGI